jgi:tripartite-type tricarboxylate transporter receptor subunit TctC
MKVTRMRHHRFAYALAAWLLWVIPTHVAHADWPLAPITLVVGFPEGSAPEKVAKILQPPLERQLRTPIGLHYQVGDDGRKALAYVANSRPDGYTVLLAPMAALDGALTGDAGSSATLIALLDDISSAKDETGDPQHSGGLWFGLFAPKGLDPSLVQRFALAARNALEVPRIREKLVSLGAAHQEEQHRATTEALRLEQVEATIAAAGSAPVPKTTARRAAARPAKSPAPTPALPPFPPSTQN